MNSLLDQIRHAYPLPQGRPLLLGLAGSVAAGKTTLAKQMADAWAADGKRIEVVSTDGFLYPNATLNERGLLLRKGFPESYDAAAFANFIEAIRLGAPVSVPVYSHQIYDVMVDSPRVVQPADIVIVEGINALQTVFTGGKLDATVYLDAAEDDLFYWYYQRGNRLRDAARSDSSSFFVRYLALTDGEWDEQLRKFWFEINLPNLHQHIQPSQHAAQFHLHKDRSHTLSIRRGISSSPI